MAEDAGQMTLMSTMGCGGKSCPTVYRKDEETLVIQGYKADHMFVTELPDGEQAVAVPISLIKELDL